MTDTTLAAVTGDGLLADAIAAAMDGDHRVLVVASDGWDTRRYPEIRQHAAERGTPWLPVRTELGRVVIGPAELPGAPGCVRCAELRRKRARHHSPEHEAVLSRHAGTLADQPSSWLTNLAADVVGALVAEEVATLAQDPESARTRNGMVYVDLATLGVRKHRFLPEPLCPNCGHLPSDNAAAAQISLTAQAKLAPDVYRVRAVAGELPALKNTYVDGESGLIRSLARGTEGGLIVAAARFGLRDSTVEGGYGRTRNYQTSQLIALLESLERYGGGMPGARRTAVRASYAEVQDQALDPRTLGSHPAESYRVPGFRFRPFDVHTPYRWVWGYSFARSAPVLVPESAAYYRIHPTEAESRPFVYEISNGCALGSSVEEAVLYGILEVAERDAFLMTWYARMGVPRLDLNSAKDRTIPLIVEAMEAETGYRIMAFDITVEQRIPCVWVMAVNPADDDRPKFVCAAGSHFDPERAAENALSELGPILTELIRRYPAQRTKAATMAADSTEVKVMSDHALLYANPDVFDRLDFLTGATTTHRLDDLPQPTAFRNTDLSADLVELVERYLGTGLDVVVVNQTTPEHEAGGFTCVKVLIPGTLPMTFGHAHRRTEGLPRLYAVPHELGYRDQPLTSADINPDPHPFP